MNDKQTEYFESLRTKESIGWLDGGLDLKMNCVGILIHFDRTTEIICKAERNKQRHDPHHEPEEKHSGQLSSVDALIFFFRLLFSQLLKLVGSYLCLIHFNDKKCKEPFSGLP